MSIRTGINCAGVRFSKLTSSTIFDKSFFSSRVPRTELLALEMDSMGLLLFANVLL
jgi:hypothetical protein